MSQQPPPSLPNTNGSQRRRVLVSAYAVSPVRGSEPGVGWNLASRLAKYHDVTLLCAPNVPGSPDQNFRQEIADHLATHGPVAGLTIQFMDPPPLSHYFQRESTLCRRTVYYTGYKAWQKKALKTAEELHRRQPFDLVHQLNISGFREPGYLWKMNVPFVWGPIAGAPDFPKRYFPMLSRKERLFYKLRNTLNTLYKHSNRCRLAAKKASHIWAVSHEDAQLVETHWHKHAQRLRESGATRRADGMVRNYDGARPLRIIWSGQHIGRKALPILLHALARLDKKSPAVEVVVMGSGPEQAHWKSLADELLLDNVRWTGWVNREKALAEVAASDVLAFTSVLEGTPQAMLEAMSLGLPVICHDTCGMGVAMTDDCGLLIELCDPTASITAFAQAIDKLARDPQLLQRLSQGALRRAEELSWDNQARDIAAVYDQVLNTRPDIPA